MPVEESQTQPERRSDPRYVVDEPATVVFVNGGGSMAARITEISLGGCRIRIEGKAAIPEQSPTEIVFRLHGITFRLAGVVRWIANKHTVGIHFYEMAWRRREAVVEVLAELKAEAEAKAAKEAADAANEDAGAADASPRESPSKGSDALSRITPPTRDVPARAKPAEVKSPATRLPAVARPFFARGTLSRVSAPAQTLELAKPAEPPAPAPAPVAPIRRERRSQKREVVDTSVNVLFIDVRAQITGRILDLSMGGCRIRCNERFPVGIYRRVEIEFNLDGLPFRLAGVVQSVHDKFTVGVRLLDLSPRKREQLTQLMQEIEETRADPKPKQE